MSTLQEQLDRLIERKGESSPLVQMLRNQIAAQESGKTFQDLYITGSVKKQEQPDPKADPRQTENDLFRRMAKVQQPMAPDSPKQDK